MRPAVTRRLGALVIALGLLAAVAVAPAFAASIVVNSLADSAPANDGICTLREAITAANLDTASGAAAGECGAGSGADAITFGVGGPITLASALPAITTDLSIAGAGAITVSGASAYQLFVITAGTVTLSGLTITGGAAANGGGIFNDGGTLTVTNSTISGNLANVLGGGIANAGGTVTVTNSTISGNSASVGGGLVGEGTEILVNAIVAGNTASVAPDGFGVEVGTTSVFGVPGGKTLADILVPAGLANNGGPTQTIALALVAGNPAIDLGTGAVCAAAPVNALDQRGLPRPAACDIGAYEAQPPTVAAHANVSVAATSAAGAVVTYTPPAGSDEQGGVAGVVCLPASGSTFAPGSTTVTCTATDAVGHTATSTFQVVVGAFVAATATPSPSPTPTPTPIVTIPNTSRAENEALAMPGMPLLLGVLGLLGLAGLWHRDVARRRRR
jgi:CSLREA domain-containing protein